MTTVTRKDKGSITSNGKTVEFDFMIEDKRGQILTDLEDTDWSETTQTIIDIESGNTFDVLFTTEHNFTLWK